MKKNVLSVVCVLLLVFCFTACNNAEQSVNEGGLWADAMYTENTELGNGDKTISVEVVAEDKSLTFTIHSSKITLGEALLEHKLIEGEKGSYGLYVKKVNGIIADYDKNQAYWGFYKNDESMNTGVDSTDIADGDRFKIVYTK